MNDYDRFSRYLVKMDAAGHLGWLFPGAMAKLTFDGRLDTQSVQVPGGSDLRCDTLAHLVSRTGRLRPWAVMPELFTSDPGTRGVERAFEYVDRFRKDLRHGPRRRDKYRVTAGLIYLTGGPEAVVNVRLPGEKDVYDRRRLRTWPLPEKDALALMDAVGDDTLSWALLGWVPLMSGGGTQDAIDRWLSLLAAKVPDEDYRRDLVTIAALFAELTENGDLWRTNMEQTKIRLSRLGSELRDEGRTEGRAEGRTEGRAEALLESITDRYGVAPSAELAARVRAQSAETLRAWNRHVLAQPTFEDFLRAIG